VSYDITLTIDTGRTYIDDDGSAHTDPVSVWSANYTANCAPMWRLAGCDLRDLHGLPAPHAADMLTRAVTAMEAEPAVYEALNPPNGWGDYPSALRFLRSMREACRTHPRTTVQVWA